ncbi:DUF892 family protein [Paraburkholderia strydomiana]
MAASGRVIAGMTVTDEATKRAISAYTFKHTEIAAYGALIEAAHAAGDLQTARFCERTLSQEVEMARWLFEHMPETVAENLARSAPMDGARH